MINQIKNKIKMAAIVAPVLAATESIKMTTGQSINLTPTGDLKTLGNMSANNLIQAALGLILVIVALVFFFILVAGGLKWITSGGDEKKVGAARAQITNALIGLVIVFAAWAILRLIGTFFGIDFNSALNIPAIQY